MRHLRGEPLAEGSAPYAQTPELTLVDAAGSAVARTTRVDDDRVRTEILAESLPLRTLLAGFACSMVMPEWVDRPPKPPAAAERPLSVRAARRSRANTSPARPTRYAA